MREARAEWGAKAEGEGTAEMAAQALTKVLATFLAMEAKAVGVETVEAAARVERARAALPLASGAPTAAQSPL